MQAAIPLKLSVLAFDIGMNEIELHLEEWPKPEGRWGNLPWSDAGRSGNMMIRCKQPHSWQWIPASAFCFRNLLFFPLVKKKRWHKDQLTIRRGGRSRDTVLFKVSVNLFVGGSVTLLMCVFPAIQGQQNKFVSKKLVVFTVGEMLDFRKHRSSPCSC